MANQNSEEKKSVVVFKRVNLLIVFVTVLLCIFGIIMVYSASNYECAVSAKYNFNPLYFTEKQAIFMLAGFVCIFIITVFINYRKTFPLALLIYVFGIVCIFLLETPLAVTVNGASRWLRIFGVQFQVAEVVKISVIIFLAYFIKNNQKRISSGKLSPETMTWVLWGAGIIPTALLLGISNDLSSSVVVALITFGITFITMHTVKMHMAILGCGIVGVSGYVWSIASKMPDPNNMAGLAFRDKRIAAWLDPERYADDAGFQVLQALYAIGRGGIKGAGLGNSIQKMGAIPEAQNDMIFSVICEELGLLGAIFLIGLFVYLLYQMFRVAVSTKDIYGYVIVIGVMLHIGIQTVVNIAVNVNVMPNTGLALPFISYGGTAVFCQLVEVGLVLSVERQNMLAFMKHGKQTVKKNKKKRRQRA